MSHKLENNKDFKQMDGTADNYFRMFVKKISHGVNQ